MILIDFLYGILTILFVSGIIYLIILVENLEKKIDILCDKLEKRGQILLSIENSLEQISLSISNNLTQENYYEKN